jgi:hypothetical protein
MASPKNKGQSIMYRDIYEVVRLINRPKFNGKTAQERHDEYAQKAYEAIGMDDRFYAEKHYQQAEYYRRILNHPNHYLGEVEEEATLAIPHFMQLVAKIQKDLPRRREEVRAAKAEKFAKKEAAAKAKAARLKKQVEQAEGVVNEIPNKVKIIQNNADLPQKADEPCKIIPFRPIIPGPHSEKKIPD